VGQREIDLIREGYTEFNKGDTGAMARNVLPEFTVTDRQELPDPQTYDGAEGAIEAASLAGEGFDDYRIEPDEIFEPREDAIVVVATQSGRGTASGAQVEGTIVHLWRMRDGKAISMHAYSSREQALEALEEEPTG
jgi:ketosteroid isomerase-like protein